jgi:hypothetical protein
VIFDVASIHNGSFYWRASVTGAAVTGAEVTGAAVGAAVMGAPVAGAAETGATEAGAIETGVVTPPGTVATGGSRERVNVAETGAPPEQKRRLSRHGRPTRFPFTTALFQSTKMETRRWRQLILRISLVQIAKEQEIFFELRIEKNGMIATTPKSGTCSSNI